MTPSNGAGQLNRYARRGNVKMIHFQAFKTVTELQDIKIPLHTIINIETIKISDSPLEYFYRAWYWA